jgi:hypothetical protein
MNDVKVLKKIIVILVVISVFLLGFVLYKITADTGKKSEKELEETGNLIRVPMANETIEPLKQITSSDITWIEIPKPYNLQSIYIEESDIVGKYSGVGATIPKGSMFYRETLFNKEDIPGTWLVKLEKGEVPTYLSIDTISTYGNSILPESYIDIYVNINDKSNKVVTYGKLIENVKILALKDSSGANVFENYENISSPAFIYFGLNEGIHELLEKAKSLSTIEITIIPQNDKSSINKKVIVSSEYLRDYIDSKTLKLPENSN